MEQILWDTIRTEKYDEVPNLLQKYSGLDINWKNEKNGNRNLLHQASFHSDSVTSLLLSHPDIDVNAVDSVGETPLFVCACWMSGTLSRVKIFLRDPRTDLNILSLTGTHLLWIVVYCERYDVIQWMIASGKELKLGEQKTDAVEKARVQKSWPIYHLLQSFRLTPDETREKVRREIGWYVERVSDLFAIVIFLCDGLLEIRRKIKIKKHLPNRARFLHIASQLPIEIQMILCHRVVGSMKENIPVEDSENAFRNLAKKVLISWPKKKK
jgi:hypothetical protein